MVDDLEELGAEFVAEDELLEALDALALAEDDEALWVVVVESGLLETTEL